MPLCFVNIGDEVIIKSINWSGKIKNHLQSLGITPGTKLSIISNNMNGSFVVSIKGSRLILGKSITSKIIVTIV